MADYVKGTNFTNLRGTPADPSVFDTELGNVQTAIASKMNTTGGTFTGPITVPAGAAGAQAPQAQEVPHIVFPAGTQMLFYQATPPVGWTQVTTIDDAFMRVVSSTTTGGTSGGTDGVVTGKLSATDLHTLTVSQMPAHTHTYTAYGLGAAGTLSLGTTASGKATGTGTTSSTGGGSGHKHNITWNPKYANVIIASKD